MNAREGMDIHIHNFLTLVIITGECSAIRPCRFIPGKEPHTLIVGLVGPGVDLEDLEKRNFLTLQGF